MRDLPRRRSAGSDDRLPLRGLRPSRRDSNVLRAVWNPADARPGRRTRVPRTHPAGVPPHNRHCDPHRVLHEVRPRSSARTMPRRAATAVRGASVPHGVPLECRTLERPDRFRPGRHPVQRRYVLSEIKGHSESSLDRDAPPTSAPRDADANRTPRNDPSHPLPPFDHDDGIRTTKPLEESDHFELAGVMDAVGVDVNKMMNDE